MEENLGRHGCSVKALALVLNKPVEQILQVIGHDGSEITWPELPEPQRRRAFHPQELVDAALHFRRHPCWIEKNPLLQGAPEVGALPIFKGHEARYRWLAYLSGTSGVLFGSHRTGRHAWAKLGPWVKDPSNPDVPISWEDFRSRGYGFDAYLMVF